MSLIIKIGFKVVWIDTKQLVAWYLSALDDRILLSTKHYAGEKEQLILIYPNNRLIKYSDRIKVAAKLSEAISQSQTSMSLIELDLEALCLEL